MPDQTDFAKRLENINAQKAARPATKPVGPRPGPRKSGPHHSATSNPLRNILFGLVGMAVLLGLTWDTMGRPDHNPLSPLAAINEQRKDDSAFQRCMDDPALRAKLKSQGHANTDYAAMLLCG